MGSILSGNASDEIKQRAKAAKFDERLSLIGLMLDGVSEAVSRAMDSESLLSGIMPMLKKFRAESAGAKSPERLLQQYAAELRAEAKAGKQSGSLDRAGQYMLLARADKLDKLAGMVKGAGGPDEAFNIVKRDFDSDVEKLKISAGEAGKLMSNMFRFSSEVFGDGSEMLIIVTELTANSLTAGFIGKFGCREYFEHNKDLLFYERRVEIENELDRLGL